MPTCSYPLTGVACVSRVYTEHAIFAIDRAGVAVVRTFGMTAEELADRLDVPIRIDHRV